MTKTWTMRLALAGAACLLAIPSTDGAEAVLPAKATVTLVGAPAAAPATVAPKPDAASAKPDAASAKPDAAPVVVVQPTPAGVAPALAAVAEVQCDQGIEAQPLVGPGRLTLKLPEKYYKPMQQAGTKALRLLVDGVDVTDGATVYAFTVLDTDGKTRCATLEYQLKSDASTIQLWSKLYRDHKLTEPTTLAIQVKPTPESDALPSYRVVRLGAVTTMTYLVGGVVMMLLAVAGFLWLLFRSDTFRDRAPEWLKLASANLADYQKAAVRPADAEAVLSRVLGPGVIYQAANAAAYMEAADQVRRSRGAAPNANVSEREIAVGLLLETDKANGRKPLPQVSFSLARVQTGMWFTFTLAAAIFLAIVFWQLPAISGSLLGILGITVASTAVSFKLDQDSPDAVGTASAGLLNDIVSGNDERTHVYRYQSVAVNLMLLCFGVGSVYNELQLPSFDPTWLAFLGVSSVFNAVGKQSEGK